MSVRRSRRLVPVAVAGALVAGGVGTLAGPADAATATTPGAVTSVTETTLPRGTTLPGSALGINNSGQIIGTGGYTCLVFIGFIPWTTCSHGLLWSKATSQATALAGPGSLGGSSSVVQITDSGTILGDAVVNNVDRTVIWKGSTTTMLPVGMTAARFNSKDMLPATITSSTGTFTAGIWANGVFTPVSTAGSALEVNTLGHLLVAGGPPDAQGHETDELVRNGKVSVLAGLPSCDGLEAGTLTDSDQVFGSCTSYLPTTVVHNLLWTVAADGSVTTKEIPFDGGLADAFGVTSGSVTTSTGHTHAALMKNGVITDIGTLGGADSYISGEDSSGRFIGESTTSYDGANEHAFVYAAGKMTDLTPTANTYSNASAINNSGEIVGTVHATKNGTISGPLTPTNWQLH